MRFNRQLAVFTLLFLSVSFSSFAQDLSSGSVLQGKISSPKSVAVGYSIKLVDTNSKGMWSSSDDAVATVNENGNITGVSAGVATISYAYANNEFQIVVDIATITIAAATANDTKACRGTAVILDDSTPGIWGIGNLVSILEGTSITFNKELALGISRHFVNRRYVKAGSYNTAYVLR